jgi:cytochrome c biogenesis factor
VVGLLAAAALPATVAVAELTDRLRLIHAAYAIAPAFVLGLLALWLARRGRRKAERSVRATGAKAARLGRLLGALGVALAVAGAIAVAFFEYLDRVGA